MKIEVIIGSQFLLIYTFQRRLEKRKYFVIEG